MEDEVFEVEELAVDPQRGAGIGEVLAFDPSPTDLGRAMRSSRRVRAMPASKAGRMKSLMLIFE